MIEKPVRLRSPWLGAGPARDIAFPDGPLVACRSRVCGLSQTDETVTQISLDSSGMRQRGLNMRAPTRMALSRFPTVWIPALQLAWIATSLLMVPAAAGEAPAVIGGEPGAAGTGAWIVSLGTTASYGPKYLGAERYGPFGSPSISIRRPSEPIEFSAPEDSLGYALLDTPELKVGPVANLRQGRNAGIDHRLTSLDPNPWALEAGAFVDVWPGPGMLRTRAEVRHGLRAHDGFAADFSADRVGKIDKLTLSAGPRLGVTDASLAQLQFGVSLAASAHNGFFISYQAKGGVQSVGLGSALSYDWSDQWRTTVYDRYDRLVGDAARSPITRRLGSSDQFSVGAGVTYSFRTDLPFVP